MRRKKTPGARAGKAPTKQVRERAFSVPYEQKTQQYSFLRRCSIKTSRNNHYDKSLSSSNVVE